MHLIGQRALVWDEFVTYMRRTSSPSRNTFILHFPGFCRTIPRKRVKCICDQGDQNGLDGGEGEADIETMGQFVVKLKKDG